MVLIPRLPDRFLQDIRDRNSLVDLIGARVKLVRQGKEYGGLCPFHEERSPSFTVSEDKGFFHCFGCGAHGDAIGWLMRHDGMDFLDAVAWLADRAGVARPEGFTRETSAPAPRVAAEPIRRQSLEERLSAREAEIAAARRIFGMAVPAEEVFAVWQYWRARGLGRLPIPADIKGSAALSYQHEDESGIYPAMVSAMRAVDGSFCGVHRTYLLGNGAGKAAVKAAKKMLGPSMGAAVRLTPACETMIVGEGIETTGSALSVFWDENFGRAMIEGKPIGAWAALSLGNICGGGIGQGPRHPRQHRPTAENPRPATRFLPSAEPDPERPGIILPDTVKCIILLQDSDGKDPRDTDARIRRAINRWTRLERRKVIRAQAFRSADFNDLLRGVA